MGLCKDCKWWGRYSKGVCDLLSMGDAREVEQDGALIDATADDDQGLEAIFVTGPNFGCIRQTPKEG